MGRIVGKRLTYRELIGNAHDRELIGNAEDGASLN